VLSLKKAREQKPDTVNSSAVFLHTDIAFVDLLLEGIKSSTLISYLNTMGEPELNAPDLLVGATQNLAKFASTLSYEDIPAPVISYVKELILDNFGVVLFGLQTPWAKMIVEMVEESRSWPTVYHIRIWYPDITCVGCASQWDRGTLVRI